MENINDTRVALVTGGSRGIGKAIVEEFATVGYAVAFTYASNREISEAQTAALVAKGHRVVCWQADVRDHRRAAEVVEATEKELGPITTLVNNAGIRWDTPLFKMTLDQWNEVVDTNLNGVFHYSRAAIGGLMRRGGAIVNVTSISGVLGMAGQTNYSASKAGVIGMTKALAREVGRFGVRVNAIAPGYIETDMTASLDPAALHKARAQVALGGSGTPQQVARMALYLASDDAAYVTGQVFHMDGGLS